VDPMIDGASRLMRGAHVPIARRASDDLILADWFIRTSLAEGHAVAAQRPAGFVPTIVEIGWRQIGNYAAFSFTSTTTGLSFAS
jgi:hypothetical protein